jgi:hypothetical protein
MSNLADKARKHLTSGLPAGLGTEHFGRKDSDRYYQLPQWVIKFGIYLKLTKNEIKLYLFFVSKADKYTCETPKYTVCDLAEHCNMNRKYIRVSILTLAAQKLLLPKQTGIRIKVIVLYSPPRDLLTIQMYEKQLVTAERRVSPLKAKFLNRRSSYETGDNLSHVLGHKVPSLGTFCPIAQSEPEQIPEWVNSREAVCSGGHYTPGEDVNEL